jgi:hypothetical protein
MTTTMDQQQQQQQQEEEMSPLALAVVAAMETGARSK